MQLVPLPIHDGVASPLIPNSEFRIPNSFYDGPGH